VKFHVDFSLFTDTDSIGVISGALESQVLPRVGETVALIFPPNGVLPIDIAGFKGLLRVETVLHAANRLDSQPSLSLQSVVLSSVEDANVLAAYLESGFGLHFDPTNL
jgi:hypothetical protein